MAPLLCLEREKDAPFRHFLSNQCLAAAKFWGSGVTANIYTAGFARDVVQLTLPLSLRGQFSVARSLDRIFEPVHKFLLTVFPVPIIFAVNFSDRFPTAA